MTVAAKQSAVYDPSVFLNVGSVDEAVRIILTPEAGQTSAQRWQNEAPYLLGLIEQRLPRQAHVLDYGCGIGRLSKPLIEKLGCSVVGVDIAPNMRGLAASCVESDRFFALPPSQLYRLGEEWADAALAVWTLQHCFRPQDDIANIKAALKPGGLLFLVNNVARAVPTTTGEWVHDGVDIDQMLGKSGFTQIERGKLDESIAPGWMREGTFWAFYRRD